MHELVKSDPSPGLPEISGILAKIDNPMHAIEQAGKWIEQSRLFGAKNSQQGMMLAWSMMINNRDPLEMSQSYHIIEGNFSMKFRKQVAKFQEAGGTYKILSRTPQLAKAEVSFRGISGVFEFSLEDAIQQPYMWRTKANEDASVVKYKREDGKLIINNNACKTNWETDRKRMQMLWARMLTDAIGTIAPVVIDGSYGDVEMDSYVLENEECASSQIVESVVVESAKPTASDVETSEPQPVAKPAMDAFTVRMATAEQLSNIRELKGSLELEGDAWREVLSHYNLASAKDLSFEQADDLTVVLMRERRQREIEKDQQDFFTGTATGSGQTNSSS